MKALIQKLRLHDQWLYNVTVLHAVLAVVTLLGLWLDPRLVTGINPWVKPIKFDVSVVFYAGSMAWILQYLPKDSAVNIGRRIAACLLIEIALIYLQAARGVASHFNISSPLNGAVFTTMGIVIVYNTILIYQTLRGISKIQFSAEMALQKLAMQYGLISLLVGSVMGGYMSAQKGHTVGAPDGGPGLPFLAWSTQFGDLRVAHFVGLHGIQFFLLLGWLLYSNRNRIPGSQQRLILHTALVGFLSLNAALFLQAILASPFIRL